MLNPATIFKGVAVAVIIFGFYGCSLFKPQSPTAPQKKIVLPEDPVTLTIIQRRNKPIPGFNGEALLKIGDISGGRVLIEILRPDGSPILDTYSVTKGKVLLFEVEGQKFYLHVKELVHYLFGDDHGVFEISTMPLQPIVAEEALANELVATPPLVDETTQPKPEQIVLAEDPVTVTIIQRETKAIPGFSDEVYLKIGDISGGQVQLKIQRRDGSPIFDSFYVKQGNVLLFKVKEQEFCLHVKQLVHYLSSDDYGIFEISTKPPPLKVGEETAAYDLITTHPLVAPKKRLREEKKRIFQALNSAFPEIKNSHSGLNYSLPHKHHNLNPYDITFSPEGDLNFSNNTEEFETNLGDAWSTGSVKLAPLKTDVGEIQYLQIWMDFTMFSKTASIVTVVFNIPNTEYDCHIGSVLSEKFPASEMEAINQEMEVVVLKIVNALAKEMLP